MRAHLKAVGLIDDELRRPHWVVNLERNAPEHKHLREIGQAVKDGIRLAGGVPFEFNTISI